MQKLSYNNLLVLFVAFLLVSPISAVQAIDVLTLNQNIPLHPLNIPYANGQITIDGELDDNLWSNAPTNRAKYCK